MGKYSDLVNKPVQMTVAGHEFKVRQLSMSKVLECVQGGLATIIGHSTGIELQDDAMKCVESGNIPLKALQLIFLEATKRDDPEIDMQDVDDLGAADQDGMITVARYAVQGSTEDDDGKKLVPEETAGPDQESVAATGS